MNKVYLKPLDSALAKKILTEWLTSESRKTKPVIAKKKAKTQQVAMSGLGRDLPNTEKELFQLEQYPLIDEKEGMEKLGGKSGLRRRFGDDIK